MIGRVRISATALACHGGRPGAPASTLRASLASRRTSISPINSIEV